MKAKSGNFFKIIAFLLCFLLIFQQSGFAQIAGELDISGHLAAFHNTLIPDTFRPLHLRYLQYNSLNNSFQLFLDKGSLKNPNPRELEDTTKALLNYFFIGISLPNDKFWVNLRPDAEDNIIDEQLAQTDVGKILLESDLQLKKDTAKATSPETPEGRKYWDKLYKKAGELFGSENITIPTLTRPWIVPDEIIIRETLDSAYIYKATLKVMLEQDYLKDSAVYNFKDERLKELNEYSSQLIREIIIPKLTKEVNSSKRYASLRQVYYSLIMAQWFKARYLGKDGLYSHLINRKDLTNLTSKESWLKIFYFKEYQKSFKDGEYNIQEPVYTPYGQTIRSYFSGGISGIAPSIPNLGTTFIDSKTGTVSSSIVSPIPPSLNHNMVVGVRVKATDTIGELGQVQIESNEATSISQGRTSPVENKTNNPSEIVRQNVQDRLSASPVSLNYSQDDLQKAAELALGRSISDEEFRAIEKAHEVGQGHYFGKQNPTDTSEKNENPDLAFTPQEIAQKARIMQEAGFTTEERRILIKFGIVGNTENERKRKFWNIDLLAAAKSWWQAREQEKENLRAEEAMAEKLRGVREWDYDKRNEITKSVVDPTVSLETARRTIATIERLLINIAKYKLDYRFLDLWLRELSEIYKKRPELFTSDSIRAFEVLVNSSHANSAYVQIGDVLGTVVATPQVPIPLKQQAVGILKGFLENPESHEYYGQGHDGIAEALAHIAADPQAPREISSDVRKYLIDWIAGNQGSLWRSAHATGEALQELVKSEYVDPDILLDILKNCENIIEKGESRLPKLAYIISTIHRHHPSIITQRTISVLINARKSIKEFREDDYFRGALDSALNDIVGERAIQLMQQSEALRPYLEHIVWHWQFGEFLLLSILTSDNQQAKLQELEEAFTILLPIRDKLFDGQIGAGLSELGYFVIRRMYGSNNLSQVAQTIIPYMNEFGLWQTDAFEIYSRISAGVSLDGADGNGYLKGVGVVTRAQLDEAGRIISQGRFDANNIVHVLANYFSILRQAKNSPIKRNLGFNDFYEFLQQSKQGVKAEKTDAIEQLEVRGVAYEGYLLREEILALRARAQAVGRPLVVVENLSYGAVALAPITEERNGQKYIVGTDIPVISTKVGSSESHSNEIVLNTTLFDEATERMILKDNPIVIVVDASTSVADPQRTSAHIPDGFKGYRNYFMAVNKALRGQVDPAHFHEDEAFLGSLEKDDHFTNLVSRLRERNESPQASSGYRLYFWYPGEKTLYLRVGKQVNTPAKKLNNVDEIAGPAIVFMQSAMEPEAVPRNIRRGFIKGEHHPAYFDDQNHFKQFYFEYREGYGINLSYKFINLSRKFYRDFIMNGSPRAIASSPLELPISEQNGISSNPERVITPGGIDFRSLPIVTQAIGNLSANISSLSLHNLVSINLDEEWQQIERMANSGITPSSERIKEYVQTSCAQDSIIQDRDKILLCISDMLRLEEERYSQTDPLLKDILVMLESVRQPQELTQVFLGKTVF